MNRPYNNIKKLLLNPIIFCVMIITINSCLSSRHGGALPMFMDEYIATTADRRFVLEEEIEGYIIKYQKSYDCDYEFNKSNATAIISHESNFITIYDYCQQGELNKGDKVIIKPTEAINKKWTPREILEPFPKASAHYGYWECKSCKYKNAFGSIELKEE